MVRLSSLLPQATALAALLACAGCGPIDLRSVAPEASGAAALQGEWRGTWASAQHHGGGDVVLRVQQFEAEPVVGLAIDHPCLQQRVYEVAWIGSRFELRRDGEPVFAGVLGPDRRIIGSYSCHEDEGSWQVVWQRALDPVVDVRGSWSGAVAAVGVQAPLALELDQFVDDGTVQVQGVLALPGLLSAAVPVFGFLRSRDGAFELSLQTGAGILPQIAIGGIGDAATRVIASGLVATSGAPLPFTQGVVHFAWQGP